MVLSVTNHVPETNTLVVGADLSTKSLAFVAQHPQLPNTYVASFDITSGKRFTPDNCQNALVLATKAASDISEMATSKTRKIAYIEGAIVAGAKNIQTTVKQAYVNGTVQAAFVSAGFEVILVPVATWKKGALGNGAARKDQVAQHIENVWVKTYVACGGDQDLLDAAAICLYGLNETNSGRRIT